VCVCVRVCVCDGRVGCVSPGSRPCRPSLRAPRAPCRPRACCRRRPRRLCGEARGHARSSRRSPPTPCLSLCRRSPLPLLSPCTDTPSARLALLASMKTRSNEPPPPSASRSRMLSDAGPSRKSILPPTPALSQYRRPVEQKSPFSSSATTSPSCGSAEASASVVEPRKTPTSRTRLAPISSTSQPRKCAYGHEGCHSPLARFAGLSRSLAASPHQGCPSCAHAAPAPRRQRAPGAARSAASPSRAGTGTAPGPPRPASDLHAAWLSGLGCGRRRGGGRREQPRHRATRR